MLPGQLCPRHTSPGTDHLCDQARTNFETDQTLFDLRIHQGAVSFIQVCFQRRDASSIIQHAIGFTDPGQLLTQLKQALSQLFLLSPHDFQGTPFDFSDIQAHHQSIQRLVINQ
ncbi:hypothetical protein D3C81_1937110 [compost metagenome]